MKLLKAGAAYYGEFVTSRFSSGAAYDATGTPTATATRNGTDDGAFTLTVTKIDTGRYKVAGTIPAYTAGDNVQVSVAATVDSVAAKGVVDEFYVVAIDLTRPSPSRAEAESLTRTLGLTDLALVTEARYLRHVSLADLHSAFQDHPVALEHFPAGALIAPPAHLRPAPAQPPQTVDHARLD